MHQNIVNVIFVHTTCVNLYVKLGLIKWDLSLKNFTIKIYNIESEILIRTGFPLSCLIFFKTLSTFEFRNNIMICWTPIIINKLVFVVTLLLLLVAHLDTDSIFIIMIRPIWMSLSIFAFIDVSHFGNYTLFMLYCAIKIDTHFVTISCKIHYYH